MCVQLTFPACFYNRTIIELVQIIAEIIVHIFPFPNKSALFWSLLLKTELTILVFIWCLYQEMDFSHGTTVALFWPLYANIL
jgi:hypothetical protein